MEKFCVGPTSSNPGPMSVSYTHLDVYKRQVPAALSFHGMKTALFAAGDNGKNPNLIYKTVEFKDMGKKQYRKYYFLNNRLCGVILIGCLLYTSLLL